MSKQKLISIILALVLIFTALPAMARAEDIIVEPEPLAENMEQPVTEIAAEQAVNEEPAAAQEEPEVTSQAVVPGNISGLTAAARSDGSVKLTWNKSTNAYKYLIYRSTTKSGGYKVVRKQRASSYADTSATGLKPSTRYYYKVVPYTQDNVRGRSSSPVTVVTKAAAPAPAIDQKLIGKWHVASLSPSMTIDYEFKADGTFEYTVVSIVFSTSAVATERGKYKTVNNMVYCTGVTETNVKFKKENGVMVETSRISGPIDDYSYSYRLGEDADGRYMQNNHVYDPNKRDPITDDNLKYRP